MKNLKHPYYPLALLLGLSLCSPYLQAATGEAVGEISATVPKTLLLEVENITPTFTYAAPTEAGSSFTSVQPSNDTAKLAFTSNVNTAKLYAKAQVTSLNSQAITPQTLAASNLAVSVKHKYNNTSSPKVTLTGNDQVIINVGNRVSGVMANTLDTLEVDGGLYSMSAVPPYGDYGITVTYTLKES